VAQLANISREIIERASKFSTLFERVMSERQLAFLLKSLNDLCGNYEMKVLFFRNNN
jgi:hypothetical protein